MTPPKPRLPRLSPQRLRVFLSYSHADRLLVKKFRTFLTQLKRERLIEIWHDDEIPPGAEFDREIIAKLSASDVVLLLISADYLASKYCYTREMRTALHRHKSGQALVIPVILRPSDWLRSPVAGLSALPTDGKPVTLWANRELAFLDIVTQLRRLVQSPWPGRRCGSRESP